MMSRVDMEADLEELQYLNAELVDALRTWQRFFDEMPKGQFGKISCDIGLMNDGFIKTARVLAKVKP